jgi:hypothetical protein
MRAWLGRERNSYSASTDSKRSGRWAGSSKVTRLRPEAPDGWFGMESPLFSNSME